jgi:hypothetical protein
MRKLADVPLLPTFPLAIGAFLLATLCCLVPDFGLTVAWGWFGFLARVVPEVAVNWGGVFTAVACLGVLAVGLQVFLRWFFAHLQRPAGESDGAERRWAWRWTASLLVLTILLFVAGIAAVGIAHQTAWLLTSPEPLFGGGMGELSARHRSENNLRQIGRAADAHWSKVGSLPPGGVFDAQGRGLHGWQTLLLPYLGEDALYQRIRHDLSWGHPDNRPAFETAVPVYQNLWAKAERDAAGYALTHYAGNVRVLGGGAPLTLARFPDGTSNTLLAGESAGAYKPWGHPRNWRDPALGLNTTPDGFGSPTKRGASFVFADGSVRFLTNDVSPRVLRALSTPDGGEEIPPDF